MGKLFLPVDLAAEKAAGGPPQITVIAPQPDPPDWNAPFGPGAPLPVHPLDDPRNPAPRRNEYPVSANLQLDVNTYKLVPFKMLRDMVDQIDLMRLCIEVRKNQVLSLDWDITLSENAVEWWMALDGEQSPGAASKAARKALLPTMTKLKAWWETPDAVNGLDFAAWLTGLLEELFVTDAVTLYPGRTRAGATACAELIDGTTIKPLLDHRGSVPQPPSPAFQQILYGFPRGEWEASANPDDEFFADELMYRPRNRRVWTPYGYSPTEAALSVADLWMKRMAWMRAEYTSGSSVETWLKTETALTPDMQRVWENVWNDELGGQTGRRRQVKVLPKGFEVHQVEEWANRYHENFDDMLVKLMCACYDVMPTEIGFPPRSGIGGKGHQEGEANSTFRKAVRPTVVWLQNLLTEFSRRYLGMPRSLKFSFLGYEVEDRESTERVLDSQVRGGRRTINEARAELGLPLFDFEEADTPFVVVGAGAQFVPNMIEQQAAMIAAGKAQGDAAPARDATPANRDTSQPRSSAKTEAATFWKFARARNGKWRNFAFESDLADMAEDLNTLGAAGDLDTIRERLEPLLAA